MSLFGRCATAITPNSLRSSTAKLKPIFFLSPPRNKLKFWYGRCVMTGAKYVTRLTNVLEDDVVLGVAALELFRDLFIEIIVAVLGFPVAERHAQFVQQGAIDVALVARQRIEFVFRDEDKIVLFAPGLEQILECLVQHALRVVPETFLRAASWFKYCWMKSWLIVLVIVGAVSE